MINIPNIVRTTKIIIVIQIEEDTVEVVTISIG